VRQVMDLLESTIDAKTVVGVETDNPKHVTQPEDAALRDFILRTSQTLPFAVGAVLLQLICWKDSATCRRAVLLADKLVNMLHAEPALTEYFGRELFSAALQGLLGEHPGHEKEDALKWELINLARNIYCRLALGLVPVDECKGIDPCNQPERPAGLLCPLPRGVLLSLPGLTPELVVEAERALRGNLSVKNQKNVVKELLEVPMQALKSARASSSGLEGVTGLFGGVDSAAKRIQDLPEKLVLTSKQQASAVAHAQWLETQDRLGDAGSLFGH
jgi:exportin-5